MSAEPDLPLSNADPIIPAQVPETNPMDVHHHSHAHSKKGIAGYFWEFLMLFLAVFCGFLAEYKLEHVIEHQREKTFMHSLAEDLSADEKTLVTYSDWRIAVNAEFDTLLMLLATPGHLTHKIYESANQSMLRFGLPDINEGTIQQLKNAGGLRLIRHEDVVNAINKHYLLVTRMRASYETERMLRIGLVETSAEVLDASLRMQKDLPHTSYALMTTEKGTLNRYMNHIIAARSVNQGLMNQLDSTRLSTMQLKQLIASHYED